MHLSPFMDLPAPPRDISGWPWVVAGGESVSSASVPVWPRISIVTPSFNQAEFLEETIRSVLLQGYPNLEYFIIDGGSSDGSVEIIEKYEPWLAGWVSEKDRGQSHAINKGFARCTGDLITFQNSDDFYYPGSLDTAARLWMQHQDCGAIVGAFRRCDAQSRCIGDIQTPVLKASTPRDLTLGPPGIYRLHQVSTFFNRNTLDRVGRHVAEDMHFVMDRDLLYRVCRASQIVLSNECFAAFRSHENSKSIASIIPFAREFSDLYLRSLNGTPAEDLLRRKMAQHRLTAGYLKAAKRSSGPLSAIQFLLKAARTDVSLLAKHSYAAAWFRALVPR